MNDDTVCPTIVFGCYGTKKTRLAHASRHRLRHEQVEITSTTFHLQGRRGEKRGEEKGGDERRGEDRAGEDRTGQDRTGEDMRGQEMTGQGRTGQERT